MGSWKYTGETSTHLRPLQDYKIRHYSFGQTLSQVFLPSLEFGGRVMIGLRDNQRRDCKIISVFVSEKDILPVWEINLPISFSPTTSFTLDNNRNYLYVPLIDGRILRYDLLTGEEKTKDFNIRVDNPIVSPLILKEEALIFTSYNESRKESYVHVYNLDKNIMQISIAVGEKIIYPPIYYQDCLYVSEYSDNNAVIYKINILEGKASKIFEDKESGIKTQLLYDQERNRIITVLKHNQNLTSSIINITLEDDSVKIIKDIFDSPIDHPCAFSKQKLFAFSPSHGKAYCYHFDSGRVFKNIFGRNLPSFPIIDKVGNCYLVSFDGILYCFDPTMQIRQFPLPNHPRPLSGLVMANHQLIIPSLKGDLYILS